MAKKIYRFKQVELHRLILATPPKQRTASQKKRLTELNKLALAKHGTKSPTIILERAIARAYKDKDEEKYRRQFVTERDLKPVDRADFLLSWLAYNLSLDIISPYKLVDNGLYGTATAHVENDNIYLEDLITLSSDRSLREIFYSNLPRGYVAGLHIRMELFNEDSGQQGWIAIQGLAYDPEVLLAGLNGFLLKKDKGDYGNIIRAIGTYCHHTDAKVLDRIQRKYEKRNEQKKHL